MHHHTSPAFLSALVFACVQISGCGGGGAGQLGSRPPGPFGPPKFNPGGIGKAE